MNLLAIKLRQKLQSRYIQVESESCSVVSNSLQPHGLYSPWNSLWQNTGMGNLSLPQGIFPTQRSNLGLLHHRRIFFFTSWATREALGQICGNKLRNGSHFSPLPEGGKWISIQGTCCTCAWRWSCLLRPTYVPGHWDIAWHTHFFLWPAAGWSGGGRLNRKYWGLRRSSCLWLAFSADNKIAWKVSRETELFCRKYCPLGYCQALSIPSVFLLS